MSDNASLVCLVRIAFVLASNPIAYFQYVRFGSVEDYLAEGAGFEPARSVNPHTLSKRAP